MEDLEDKTLDFISKFSDVLNAGTFEQCADEYNEINLCSGSIKYCRYPNLVSHEFMNFSTCCRLVHGIDCP
jgi:hypothetical protein